MCRIVALQGAYLMLTLILGPPQWPESKPIFVNEKLNFMPGLMPSKCFLRIKINTIFKMLDNIVNEHVVFLSLSMTPIWF